MRVDYAIEPLSRCWQECLVLAQEHWQETERYRHGQSFNPNTPLYFEYEARGQFIMGTARDMGQLVGFAGMYVVPSAHTQQLIATEDTVFILPSHRKGRVGLAFVKFLERACEQRGVVEILWSPKLANPAASRILDYLGYSMIGSIYSKQFPPRADSPTNDVVEAVHVCSIASSGS